MHLLDVQRRVLQNPQVTTETEVLLVVWQERHLYAGVAIYLYGINDIEPVEADSITSDRRCEGELQEAHLIIVDVYLSEYIFGNDVVDVSCLYNIVDAGGLLCIHEDTFLLRVLAIVLVRHLLRGHHGQHSLAGSGVDFYLILQIFLAGIDTRVEGVLANVIERDGHLLVVAVLVEVLVLKLRLLACGNDTTHQLHGRVFLPGVFVSL